ncbi:GATOR complex protein NPRL3 [Episyrphus balteatus]|uniref:GATOR complex protein NPRL3 n=1 Tax=Episyrphus balteatus TaxID=286459 RepID=UPI0024854FE2|nr:GATOR complex protein NPRL3 [Episyrphus balteatus]
MEVNPLAVIIVNSDSKGDRLLFRYPYRIESDIGVINKNKKRNPYAINTSDDILQKPPQHASNITKGHLTGFTDEVLSTLFAVKSELCNQKFELKVNDVRFVSHPTLMQRKEFRKSSSTERHLILINIVFALHAQASFSIVKSYYQLSKKLGLALKMEEQRVGYLSEEISDMIKTHDEVANMMELDSGVGSERDLSAFDMILEKSSLAQAIRAVHQDLCTTGLLNTTLNNSLTLSFCLPQKAHQSHKKGCIVEPEAIDKCLKSLKPYHGMLLLVDFAELLDCVPPSGASMLLQFFEVYNPLKSLQNMASDADLHIDHVNKLVGHLVYWAKATIIYPLCETNVYVIAPDAPLHTKSHLVEKFAARFSGMSLFEVISDFSLPTSIGHLTTPLQQTARQRILAQMVLWMLQHHLLMQLHTYVQFMPSDMTDCDNRSIDFNNDVIRRDDDTEQDIDEVLDDEIPRSSLGQTSDDDLNDGSMLSMSSQPLPVPNISGRSITEDRYSAAGSTVSDNIAAQPSSSHKSNFSMTASMSTDNCDSIDSIEDEEKIKDLLNVFQIQDRNAIQRIPASANVDDLSLMVKLYQAGYFKSEHHLEEIMYFENLRRWQLLQLLDKFRDVLVIYETEDPAIASMYQNTVNIN